MPKISVIVPVYNVEKYLSRCVDSILNQTFADFELILVDDGSPDNSGKICDEYAKKDKRVVVIHKENGGVSSARNKGIEISSGELITFVDSDDSIKPQFLQDAYERIFNADAYISGLEMLSYDDEVLVKTERFGIGNSSELSVQELYERVEIDYPQMCICGPWCKLYRSEIIKTHNIEFDLDLSQGEDTVFNLKYFKNCKTVYFDSQCYYLYYRQNAESLFSKYRKNIYEVHCRVYNFWREIIDEIGVSAKGKEAFEQLYLSLMVGCIHYVYNKTKNKNDRKEIINKVISNPCIKKIDTSSGKRITRLIKNMVIKKRKGMLRVLFALKYR